MADMTFNTPAGQVVDRKLLILYLNTGTNSAPVWSPIGKRVEESSMEYDYSEYFNDAATPEIDTRDVRDALRIS